MADREQGVPQVGLSQFEGLRLATLPGVFAPTRSDTALLWRAVSGAGLVRGRVLEVCSGSGALALCCARAGAEVTAVDAWWRAALTIRWNSRRLGLPVDVRRGDLLAPVARERFDLVLANPPYLPAPPGRRGGADLAWDGGRDGRALLDRLCGAVRDVLAPGGSFALVHSSLANLERSEEQLSAAGLAVRRLAEHEGPLGPLASAHRDHLGALGVLDQRAVERMAVIVATAGP